MRRVLAFTIAVTITCAQVPSFGVQLAGAGVITGTVSGPKGALGGITVRALDESGTVVASTATTRAGAFSLNGLHPGTFVVQAVGANGAVIGTSTAALTATLTAVSVSISATAGALAAAAATVVAPAAGAAGGGIGAGLLLTALGAAAAGLGTLAIIATGEDVSGSR